MLSLTIYQNEPMETDYRSESRQPYPIAEHLIPKLQLNAADKAQSLVSSRGVPEYRNYF